jgi:succinyl-diaminopimelate desuccinylase
MIDKNLFDRLASRIDSYEEAMIDMQFKLSSVPALSPENGGDGEYNKSRLLLFLLDSMSFPNVSEINSPDSRVSSGIRPNLILTLPGKTNSSKLWILTHMDIVPPGPMKFWSHDPYQGRVKDGNIYGRGTEDNQQDMVASIFAVKALLDEGITPEHTIGLAFVSDEETASERGLKYILENKDNPFKTDDLIVVPDSGNDEGTIIEIAEKSILWLHIETIGKQCHGSRPKEGKNAFLAASHLAVRLNDLHQQFAACDPLYDPPGSTFQPTKKEANVPNINTIPGEDVFYMDCRVLPMYPLNDVLAEIRKTANEIENRFSVSVRITPVHQVQAPASTPSNAPVVLSLKEAIKDVYHVVALPVGIGAGTIAAFFRSKGYCAAVWCRTTQTAHQPDEHCRIANMLGNAKVFAHLYLQKRSRME